ncbi:hypothetical protein [Nocardioides marmorisolisilvae]|uniref:DUF3352 domain-containing protein n=1 Tax=Nocardioides marmorisolisilvae TaxID=1542737 RepID=A0A3N0DPE9_9ACTN|nr:hypothetical protein [Nocardioides marmorisolisilvae]RNL77518.1 hypothetical protein EFL95_15950 [Nocardioides marmorisolisilvae]
MAERRRNVTVAVIVLVVLGGLAVVGARIWSAHDRTDLRRALDVVPSSTLRLSFTDWAAVRTTLGSDPGEDPTTDDIQKLISKGYDTDFTAVSSIEDSAEALQEHFGFSPATIEWEAFAQGRSGATMVVRMPDGFDFDAVRRKLETAGFTKPKDDDGVWNGGVDLVASLDETISPELQYVAVLADQHLIVTSDTESYAKKAAQVAQGHGRSLGDNASVRDTIAPLDEPAAAMLWANDFACSDLAMSQAATDDQDTGNQLVNQAGGITPLSGLVMALGADRSLTVSELFESSRMAKDNLRPRAKLIVGPAAGRGGSFSDDLKLTKSHTDGSTVQLVLEPKTKTGFVLSALDSGPVLFATC